MQSSLPVRLSREHENHLIWVYSNLIVPLGLHVNSVDFALSFICSMVSAYCMLYPVHIVLIGQLYILWCCLIKSVAAWSLSALHFWFWTCIPDILIPKWVATTAQWVTKHHTLQDTHLLPSLYRVLRRPITTIDGKGIYGTNFSDWGRGGKTSIVVITTLQLVKNSSVFTLIPTVLFTIPFVIHHLQVREEIQKSYFFTPWDSPSPVW